MKKLFVMLAALLALALPKVGHAVDVEGIYAGALGGINFLNYSHKHHNRTFKAGWLAGVNVGYRMCSGIRAEAEATFRSNKPKHARHSINAWSFMANGYYEITNCYCITPYIGAGIGYDTVRHKDECRDETSSSSHRHQNGFAWQVMAGGFYDIDECMEIGIGYRFHNCQAKRLKYFYNNIVDFRINMFF